MSEIGDVDIEPADDPDGARRIALDAPAVEDEADSTVRAHDAETVAVAQGSRSQVVRRLRFDADAVLRMNVLDEARLRLWRASQPVEPDQSADHTSRSGSGHHS
jgi:hypothetical protein